MDEGKFLTEIRHSFEKLGSFAYKIPDSANMRGKFSLAKPFDMVAEIEGSFIAIEGKVRLDGQAWPASSLRDTQKLGLAKVEKFKNRSYVFLCWREQRGKYYLVVIPFRSIKGKRSFLQAELKRWPYKIERNNKTGEYDLTEFFKWFKMGI